MIFWFSFQAMIQSCRQIPISLHFIMALSSNSSFEQQNQFVPLSAALAGSSQTDMSHLPENNPTMEEDSSVFLLHAPGGAKFRHCAHFQLKQTAGLVYNISLMILIAGILDNGEQGEKIVS